MNLLGHSNTETVETPVYPSHGTLDPATTGPPLTMSTRLPVLGSTTSSTLRLVPFSSTLGGRHPERRPGVLRLG